MKSCMTLLFLVSFIPAQARESREWEPSRDFLRAVCHVESSNGQFTYGDDGRSLGDFQLSEAAWLDVNEWRKARRLKTYTYHEFVYNSFVNRAYAANYMTILHGELSRKLRRPPSHEEIYAAYNMGLGMFAQCDYNLRRVNAVTRAKCRLISEILEKKTAKL